MVNLLINGNFDVPLPKGHEGWNRVNNLWPISTKPSNPSPNHTAPQWDADYNRKTGLYGGWPIPSEDWLSQVAQAPDPHTTVTFSITEIRHPTEYGIVWIAIEGSYDGENWTEIWRRDGFDGVEPAATQWDWHTHVYPIVSDHSFLKITFYGNYVNILDGWKFTDLSLTAE